MLRPHEGRIDPGGEMYSDSPRFRFRFGVNLFKYTQIHPDSGGLEASQAASLGASAPHSASMSALPIRHSEHTFFKFGLKYLIRIRTRLGRQKQR